MSATIEIYGLAATVTDLEWSCENKAVEKILNAWTKLGLTENGGIGGGGDPDKDHTAAGYVIRQLHAGKIIAYDENDDDGLDENGNIIIY